MGNHKKTIEELIGKTQDGRKINGDVYGRFLQELIDDNTDEHGFVDADELRDNLRYALHEFSKAMKSIETIADTIREMEDHKPDPAKKWVTFTPEEFDKLLGE